MSLGVRAAQVALGAFLLASGALKVGSRTWRRDASAFGAPRLAVPLVPWAELVLGGLVVAGVGLPWTPLAALALLATFTVAVAVRVAQRRAVPCGCFGELRARPVGPGTLVRNAALLVLATIASVPG